MEGEAWTLRTEVLIITEPSARSIHPWSRSRHTHPISSTRSWRCKKDDRWWR